MKKNYINIEFLFAKINAAYIILMEFLVKNVIVRFTETQILIKSQIFLKWDFTKGVDVH